MPDEQASGPPPQHSRDREWYWDGTRWQLVTEMAEKPPEDEEPDDDLEASENEGDVEEEVYVGTLPDWPPAAEVASGWDGPRLVLRQGYTALIPFFATFVPVILLVVVLSVISRQYLLYAALLLVVLIPLNLALSGWLRALAHPPAILGLDPVAVRATDGRAYDLVIPWRAVRAVRVTRYLGLAPRVEVDVDMQAWRPNVSSNRGLIVLQRDFGNRMRAGRLGFFPAVADQAQLEEWLHRAMPERLLSQ
jgi:hypothetical protein